MCVCVEEYIILSEEYVDGPGRYQTEINGPLSFSPSTFNK